MSLNPNPTLHGYMRRAGVGTTKRDSGMNVLRMWGNFGTCHILGSQTGYSQLRRCT